MSFIHYTGCHCVEEMIKEVTQFSNRFLKPSSIFFMKSKIENVAVEYVFFLRPTSRDLDKRNQVFCDRHFVAITTTVSKVNVQFDFVFQIFPNYLNSNIFRPVNHGMLVRNMRTINLDTNGYSICCKYFSFHIKLN